MFPLQSCVKVFNHDYLENDFKEPWRFNKVDDQGGHRKDEGDSNLERQNLLLHEIEPFVDMIISEHGKNRTRILPAMLWPDISSPAQSLAERRRSPLSCQSFFAWNRIWRTRLWPTQTWNLSKNLHNRRFQGKKFTQKTHNFRHLLNRDKKCVNALNWDKTSKKCSVTM